MEMNKVSRDPFFDNVKIILMLLVVLGHVLPIDLKDRTNLAVYEWIFSFHMPLFVFISGYFTKIADSCKFWNGIMKLLETLVVFTIIHLLFLIIKGKHIGIGALYSPQWTLWYMVSLIWWRMILYFIPNKIRDNYSVLITIGIVMCLLAGFIPLGSEFSFQRAFSFLPFFLMGYVAGKEKLIDKLHMNSTVAVTVMVLAGLGFFVANNNMNDCFYQKSSYFHYDSLIIGLCIRTGWLVFATIMSICFLSLIPRKEYKWTHFGQFTLFIYMWHAVILKGRGMLREISTAFPSCVVYAMLVVGIIYLMSKVRFFHWLLNPVTNTFCQKKDR